MLYDCNINTAASVDFTPRSQRSEEVPQQDRNNNTAVSNAKALNIIYYIPLK